MNFFKNRFILRTLFGAYILFLIVIMLANGLLVGNACRQMNRELQRTNDYYLRMLKLNIDSLFSDADAAEREIAGDNEVNAFSGYTHLDSRARFDAAMLVETLGLLGTDNRTAANCLLYFPNSDTVVTPKAFYNSEAYYNLHLSDYGSTYADWLADLRTPGARRLTHTLDGRVAFHYSVSQEGEILYHIQLTVSEAEMFSPIYSERYADDGSAVVILSKRGNLLLSSDKKEYNFQNAMFEKEYEIRRYRPIDHKLFVYFVNSDWFDCRYVLVTEDDYNTDRIQGIFLIGLGVSVMCLLCIGVILLAVNKKNSGRLEGILEELGDDDGSLDGDEFSVIRQKIVLSRMKKEAIEEKLEQQTDLLRNSVVVNFLLGYTDSRNIGEKLAAYHICPRYESWFALAVCVFDYGILSDLQNADTIFVLNNMMEDLTPGGSLLRVDIDGMLVYLVNTPDPSREEREKYAAILDRLARLAKENFQIAFYSAVSTVKEGLPSLPGVYREAASAIESARFYDVETTVLYDEICEVPELFDESADRHERNIINAVRLGDTETAAQEIDALFRCRPGAVSMAKWRYEAAVYNILSAISSQNPDEALQQKLQEAAASLPSSGMPGMKQQLLSVVATACESTRNAESSNNDVYRRIRQYVEENYTRADLDVTRIGEELGMAPFYLSRVFKNCCGEKLVGFINSLRVQRAKELLTDIRVIRINDVAAQCGYENVRTFLKVFKEKEGMTPTQYRKIFVK